jgi:acetolactate decarboxylase
MHSPRTPRSQPHPGVASLTWAGVLLAFAAGCGTGNAPPEPGSALGDSVNAFGSLHAVMMENDTSAVIDLATLTPDSTLYGVGALAGLAGEITIAAGAVHLARPDDTFGVRETVNDTSGAWAALLVVARVKAWQDVPIEAPIPFEELEKRVGEMAAGAGVDVAQPFPFLIEGPMRDLKWHVIDGRRLQPDAGGHEAHLAASAQRGLPFGSAVLVGFYSTRHEGVFTHMGARTHVHLIVPAARSSGHLDGIGIEPGATLRVPAR